MMDTTERRHYIDAKLQAALELLEKCQAMISIAWEDRAAASNLAYCDVMAVTASEMARDAAESSRLLYVAIQREENSGEGIERSAA